MLEKLPIIGLRILTAMFFTGLVGCAVVVVISWVSILKDGLSEDNKKPQT